jgi:predicted metal-dependent HD superfamily phosphohydrolase
MATKGHTFSDDPDTNLFTDADLSVLGKPWPTYEAYFKNVRKEYAIYPDFLYKPGRKKVLQHFLTMPRIFKTEYFYDAYESNARENITRELET